MGGKLKARVGRTGVGKVPVMGGPAFAFIKSGNQLPRNNRFPAVGRRRGVASQPAWASTALTRVEPRKSPGNASGAFFAIRSRCRVLQSSAYSSPPFFARKAAVFARLAQTLMLHHRHWRDLVLSRKISMPLLPWHRRTRNPAPAGVPPARRTCFAIFRWILTLQRKGPFSDDRFGFSRRLRVLFPPTP